MRSLLVIPCLLAILLCGCPSGFTGIYPYPVRLLEVDPVVLPTGTLTAGDSAEFSVTWLEGRSPYTVIWDFGEGAAPNTPGSTVTEFADSVIVSFVNDTENPIEYDGFVTIKDDGGDSLSSTFKYTVDPAN